MSAGDAVQLSLGALFFIFAIGTGIGLMREAFVTSEDEPKGANIAAFVFFTAIFTALSTLFFALGGGLGQ